MLALKTTQDERQETRAYASAAFPIALRDRAHGRLFSAVLANVSEHGLMVETDHAIGAGEAVQLLTLAGPIELIVCWQAQGHTDDERRPLGLVVRDPEASLTGVFSQLIA